jgi:serine/threonine protein kinase
MIIQGDIVTLCSGTQVVIGDLLGAGGQGMVYRATERKSGQTGVYKVLKNRSAESLRRVKFLVDQHLDEVSELLCTPRDYCNNGHLGHFAPLAPGTSLEEHLEKGGGDYFETYKAAIALCHGLALLNQRGIAQGDIGAGNAKAHPTAAGLELYLIDFDNYSAAGLPPPACFGQPDRMAPELRCAWKSGKSAVPDERSDRFALTTLLHDMVLAKRVASGFDATPDDEDRALSGGWPHDPLYGKGPPDTGGYPSAILNAELATFFRRGLSANRDERPSAGEWTQLLGTNFWSIWIDPRCHGPSFIDPSKTRCPHCGREFPRCKLVFPALGKEVRCDSASVSVGRALLLSPKVSALHAVVRRCGPETRIIIHGRNGTFRWNSTGWKQLNGEAIIQPGDRLRFADVECRVEELT